MITLFDKYQMYYYRRNPVEAAEELLVRNNRNLVLTPHQKDILLDLWSGVRFPMHLVARGGGGTTIYAVYSILRAILFENEHLGTIAAYRGQADVFMDEVLRFYEESPVLKEFSRYTPVKSYGNRVWRVSSTGSIIRAVDMMDGGTKLRGMRFTKVLVDQFAELTESQWQVIAPLAWDGDTQLALLSVCSYRTPWVYRLYNSYKTAVDDGDIDYSLLEYDVNKLRGFMDSTVIEYVKNNTDSDTFDREYNLVWV